MSDPGSMARPTCGTGFAEQDDIRAKWWARELCIAAGDDPDEQYRSTVTWKQYAVDARRAMVVADKERAIRRAAIPAAPCQDDGGDRG